MKNKTDQELVDTIVELSTAVSMYTPNERNGETGASFYRYSVDSIPYVIELCNRRAPSFIAKELQTRFNAACRTAQTRQIKGETGRSDTLSDDEKLERFKASISRLGTAKIKGIKTKREKAIVRAVQVAPTRITELSGLFADLADDDGPIQDEAFLKTTLVNHKLMTDADDLSAWLKG